MLGTTFNPKWKKGFALGAVSLLAVVAFQWLTLRVIGTRTSLLIFTIPVLTAAYYGGLVPGLAATLVSGAVGAAAFVQPYQTDGRVDVVRLAIFAAQGILVSVLTEELHRSRSRSERDAADLREADERFRLLMDGTRDYAIYGLDGAGRIDSWNLGAERQTGYAETEAIGQHMSLFYPPEDRAIRAADEVVRAAREEGVCRSQGWRIRRDGSRYWVNLTVTALRDATGDTCGYAAVARDITCQRQTELAMEDNLARLRAIFDTAADAIVTFDADGLIESANPSATRFFGYAAGEFGGRDVRELLDIPGPGAMTAAAVRGRLESGVGTAGRRRDGSAFPVEVFVSDMELAGRRLCACFVKDVTRRKAAEGKLRQLNEQLEQRVAERTRQLEEVNEELKAFTYTVSHDLRSPLRSVQRFAQVMLSEDPGVTDEARGEAARRTLASSARMDRQIQDLLEYSRLTRQEIQPQRVSLILVVQEVLGQLERDPHYAKSQVVVREPLPIVLGHRAILVRVFTNLLTNATKFVAPPTTPWVHVWAEEHGETVRVWVEDNGVGIDPKDQERIFEPFCCCRREKEEEDTARGLGLAIVRKGVERLGGRIGLESEAGSGSKFWVELPRG